MAIIITIFAILFPIVFWLWIHRPYMRCEKMTDRFLDGYIFFRKRRYGTLEPDSKHPEADENGRPHCAFSPVYGSEQKTGSVPGFAESDPIPTFFTIQLESIRGEAIIAGLDSVADMTEALARFSVTPLPRWRIWFLWRKNWITVRLIWNSEISFRGPAAASY